MEQGRDPHWVTAMLDRAELRTLRNTLVHSDPAVFERVLKAWKMGAQDQLIADATILEDLLFVRTCALETVEVELQELKPLRKASREALLSFEVDQDGAALYWPELDVHLDLEAIQVARDPSLRQKYQRERLVDDQLMGKAIKAIREEAGLRQSDIEGVSPRQIRRIENGEVRARSTTLKSFAEAHGLSFNDYLNRLSEKMGEVRG